MITNYNIEDYEFNPFEEKIMKKFVEVVRPDMSVSIIKEAIRESMYAGIKPTIALKHLSRQIEEVEDEEGGISS
tara:strand:+ start:1435 stop:1656 length:222 start_codon:yes stop_codon:yes gene_type:complete